MISDISDVTILNNGVEMPWLGLGLLHIPNGEKTENAVRWALNAGYRLIDTASFYGNEKGIGNAILRSDIPREEMFITSKVWNNDQGYERTLAAFEVSLENLGLEYIDLYLIHWPGPSEDLFIETWRALEKLYQYRRVRAIGLSNFMINHLEILLPEVDVMPAVNQVEFHPYLQQTRVHQFCRDKDIQLEAWRPLIKGRAKEDPVLIEISNKYNKSSIQISLRWLLQLGIVAIPKSQNRGHIFENAEVFDFQLSAKDIEDISAIDRNERFGPDPNTFNRDFG